ncbi:hypothetical protein K461DRAFT_280883 [Myriangium duriaei CBS 260.36]|uniref:Uncharacterized protein n=1 Tax=Myriangium duriaei CBS 260.36 TaxID=1168546 RepID=A0A9P4IZU7_9PEZI|nr:hypothetical protein K461DRAFT_280883 [Myriangium duriaei CBS 260.36]
MASFSLDGIADLTCESLAWSHRSYKGGKVSAYWFQDEESVIVSDSRELQDMGPQSQPYLIESRQLDPRNRPCVVVEDYLDPIRGLKKARKGAQGCIEDIAESDDGLRFRVTVPNLIDSHTGESATGWVPSRIVKFGYNARFRSLKITGLDLPDVHVPKLARGKVWWTKVETGTLIRYSAPPIEVSSDVNGEPVINFFTHPTNKSIMFHGKCLKGRVYPGDLVYPMVEIMHEGRHEVPFARLPTIGIWANWARGNSLGIAITWKDRHGKWQKLYFEDDTGYEFSDLSKLDVPGTHTGYARVTGLRRFLEQEDVRPMPAWAWDVGTANMVELRYSHLRQTIVMRRSVPDTFIALETKIHGMTVEDTVAPKQLKEQYAAAGIAYDQVNLKFGTWVANRPGDFENGHDPDDGRRSCNFCYLLNEPGGDRFSDELEDKCKKETPKVCVNGWSMGCLPLVFTPAHELQAGTPEGDRRRDAFTMLRFQNPEPFEVDDPCFCELKGFSGSVHFAQ